MELERVDGCTVNVLNATGFLQIIDYLQINDYKLCEFYCNFFKSQKKIEEKNWIISSS